MEGAKRDKRGIVGARVRVIYYVWTLDSRSFEFPTSTRKNGDFQKRPKSNHLMMPNYAHLLNLSKKDQFLTLPYE